VPGTQFESSRVHHAFRRLQKFPVVVEKGPALAGFLFDRWVSETANPWFGLRVGAFFSAPEIPFPGNGDRSRQRLGSKAGAIAAEHRSLRFVASLVTRAAGSRSYGAPDAAGLKPTCANASRMRAFDRDLIRGRHYGQRSCEPHQQIP
jgi:hypothetical protein